LFSFTFHGILFMTNNANKKLLANCLVLNRQRPIAYLEQSSPLKAVDVRWFAPPTYSHQISSPPPPTEIAILVQSPCSTKQKRRMSLGRGPSLRLKTLFAAPATPSRKFLPDIAVHPLIQQREIVNELIEQDKSKCQRTQVEGKYFDELSIEDRFWLRNTTTHIYQQQSTANESWLVRRLSIPKRPPANLSVNRLHRKFSLKRALGMVLN
jgi:hypothetical protein